MSCFWKSPVNIYLWLQQDGKEVIHIYTDSLWWRVCRRWRLSEIQILGVQGLISVCLYSGFITCRNQHVRIQNNIQRSKKRLHLRLLFWEHKESLFRQTSSLFCQIQLSKIQPISPEVWPKPFPKVQQVCPVEFSKQNPHHFCPFNKSIHIYNWSFLRKKGNKYEMGINHAACFSLQWLLHGLYKALNVFIRIPFKTLVYINVIIMTHVFEGWQPNCIYNRRFPVWFSLGVSSIYSKHKCRSSSSSSSCALFKVPS